MPFFNKEWELRPSVLVMLICLFIFTSSYAFVHIIDPAGTLLFIARALTLVTGGFAIILSRRIFGTNRKVLIDDYTLQILKKTGQQAFFTMVALMLALVVILEYAFPRVTMIPAKYIYLFPSISIVLYLTLFLWNDFRGDE